jgi:hypothetical protein
MNGVDWAGADVVLACQLVSATALAAHLLILRPRAAAQDLLLDARIIQDELDLAERLGHITSNNLETIALQQLLRRIRQNPSSASLVLERIPTLAQALDYRSRPAEAEYLIGALDRLSDASRRYLRGAWPRAGVRSARLPLVPTQHRDPVEIGYLQDDQLSDDDLNAIAGLGVDDSDIVDVDVVDVVDVDEIGADDFDDAEATDEQPDRDRDSNSGSGSGSGSGSKRSGSEWTPTWVDLVRAETPRRNSSLGQADRHARPYRPARPSAHASSRRLEQLDRSSVLPR